MEIKHRTIALNMIVGPGDGPVLKRCLESFDCRKWFDEVVIVATTTDTETVLVAQRFATKLLQRSWTSEGYPFGDFAGARNAAYDASDTDYVMWLDSDDVVEAKDHDKIFTNLRTSLDKHYDNVDVYMMQYVLGTNNYGLEACSINRERIWKKSLNIKWKYPCHEQIIFNWNIHHKADLTGLNIIHQPQKVAEAGLERNIKILEHEYSIPVRRDSHIRFYLARDLAIHGEKEAAIPILVKLVTDFNGNELNLFEASMFLTERYLYDKDKIMLDGIDISQWFANVALTLNGSCAETHVFKGDVMLARDKKDVAVQEYKTAMTREYGNGYLQRVAYYEAIPASRLATIYYNAGDVEQALYYNKLALEYFKDKKDLLFDRKKYIIDLVKAHLKKEDILNYV